MVTKEFFEKDVVELYTELKSLGIKIWIDGGWSVDALLGKQLRPHEDLDIAVEYRDVPKLRAYLESQEYIHIPRDDDKEWSFVLGDDKGRKIDIHGFIYDEQRNIVGGIMYPTESLTGTGTINGVAVRCISPEYMVKFLAPWIHKWPEKYLQAVAALCEKFEIALPEEYIKYKNLIPT